MALVLPVSRSPAATPSGGNNTLKPGFTGRGSAQPERYTQPLSAPPVTYGGTSLSLRKPSEKEPINADLLKPGRGERRAEPSRVLPNFRLSPAEQRVRPFPKNTHCPKNTQCKFELTVLHTPSAGRSSQSRPSPSPTAARGAAHGAPLTAHAAARASAASPRQPGTATSPSAEKRPRLRDAAETFSHLQRSVDTGSAYLLGQLLLPMEQHPRPCRKRGIPLASGAARSPLAAPRGDAFCGGDAFQEGSCGLQNLMETHCKPQTPPIPAGLTWAVVSKDKISGRTTPAAVSHVRAVRLWHPPPPRSGGPRQPHCPAQARAHQEGAWKPVASARTPPPGQRLLGAGARAQP